MGHRGSSHTTDIGKCYLQGILFSEEVVNTMPLDIQYNPSYVFKKGFTEQEDQKEVHQNVNDHCLSMVGL